MNKSTFIHTVRKWSPSIIVTITILIGAYYYHQEIMNWFGIGDYEVSHLDQDSKAGSQSMGSQSMKQPETAPSQDSKAGSQSIGSQSMKQPEMAPSTEASGEIAHYTCSMHPSVKSQDPGTCPICKMDLTPVTQQEVETGTVLIDSKRRQLIGVRTSPVKYHNMTKVIRSAGIVEYDETRLTDINLKFRGWIEKMYADFTGKEVKKGETLFTIYSPELLEAQQAYLEARKSTSGTNRTTRTLESSRNRLLYWDLTSEQLAQIEKKGQPMQYVPIQSPVSGTIIKKNSVQGSEVKSGQMIYRIADLSVVWVEAELYESELPLVHKGQSVEITVSYLPGTKFSGEIAYKYPYLDPKTRRGRVRIEVKNKDGLLKPGMYTSVYLQVPLGERLAVPEEAVLYGGENNVVFLDLGEGRIRPKRITLGVRSAIPGLDENFVEVIDGLNPGDTVMTSGNFLIASESKLKSGIEEW